MASIDATVMKQLYEKVDISFFLMCWCAEIGQQA